MFEATSAMRKPACVFHHPFPVVANGSSGSRVRPYQMLKAFSAMGYEVETVTGYGRERRQKTKRLQRQIAGGRTFDFVYSESHSLPILLTEPHHLPTYPNLDHGFLQWMAGQGVPIGIYYRDVHWRFGQFYRPGSTLERMITRAFYWYDWNRYRAVGDHLFLPSLGMAEALPTRWPSQRISALPPGISSERTAGRSVRSSPESLRLFYVGGVTPPLYDLSPLFAAAEGCPSIRLKLCCREEEWLAVAHHYTVPWNVEIVHASGGQLDRHYDWADAIAILWRPNAYLDFAMPVKLFEALAHGLPVITSGGTETARFVARGSLGWVVESTDQVRQLTADLLADRTKLGAAYSQVAAARRQHTWEARAKQVIDTLVLSAT